MIRYINKKFMEFFFFIYKYEIDESNFLIVMIFIYLIMCIIIKYNVKIIFFEFFCIKIYIIYSFKLNE